MSTTVRNRLPAWLFLIVVLAVWETAVRSGWVASYLLPAPSEIYATSIELWPEIWSATQSTLGSIVWGLAASFTVGVTLAISFFAVPILRRAILPFCVFFQTVPIIAIAPLLVIWFGFGPTTVKASAFIVSLFPILANTLTGLEETDPLLRELFALYKPSRWKMITNLQIPSAIPYILTGLRISVGLATIGAIVGEFIAGIGGRGGGIGFVITEAAGRLRMPYLFAAALTSSLLGIAIFIMVSYASARFLRHWHESAVRREL